MEDPLSPRRFSCYHRLLRASWEAVQAGAHTKVYQHLQRIKLQVQCETYPSLPPCQPETQNLTMTLKLVISTQSWSTKPIKPGLLAIYKTLNGSPWPCSPSRIPVPSIPWTACKNSTKNSYLLYIFSEIKGPAQCRQCRTTYKTCLYSGP